MGRDRFPRSRLARLLSLTLFPVFFYLSSSLILFAYFVSSVLFAYSIYLSLLSKFPFVSSRFFAGFSIYTGRP